MSSPPHKKLKSTAEDADEETPMHIISSETQNRETQNSETQNNETQNRETQNNETQNRETQNSETQNRETQNSETQNNETQNRETQNNETQNRETQNSETQNRETQNSETQNNETQNRETQNSETQNRETQNSETQNNETQNRETQNNETQNRETQNSETQNRETQNSETQNNETQNRETQNSETQNRETQNNETQNSETQNREIPMHMILKFLSETQNREIPMHMILKFLSETQNRDIPDHVISTEILPRLPANSLLRFKRVCKEWDLLISSSDFINDHAFRPNPLSSRSVLSIANDSSLTAIDYGDLDFTYFGQYSSVNPIFLIGSSHGLVLLISAHATKGELRFPCLLLYFKFDFRVFNPVLGGLGNTISPPPNFLQSTDFAAKDYSFGFGYSSTHEEFYIVAINFLVSLNRPVVVVFLYNCSTQQWIVKHKAIAEPRNEEQRLSIVLEDVWYKHSGTLVNEALHWGAIIIGMNHQCIVGLDLGSKKLTFMNLPSANFGEPAVIIRSAFSLCCLNDFLCAWAYSKGGRGVEMWMMKEHGVRKSWTKLFCADMKSTYWYFFGKPRQIMIFNFDGLRYVDFSCITPIWSKVYFPDQVKAVNYVQSLLSPDAIIKYPTSGEENE